MKDVLPTAQNTLIQQMGESVQWEYILKMLKVIHGFSAGYTPLTYHSVWGRFLLLSPTEPWCLSILHEDTENTERDQKPSR